MTQSDFKPNASQDQSDAIVSRLTFARWRGRIAAWEDRFEKAVILASLSAFLIWTLFLLADFVTNAPSSEGVIK